MVFGMSVLCCLYNIKRQKAKLTGGITVKKIIAMVLATVMCLAVSTTVYAAVPWEWVIEPTTELEFRDIGPFCDEGLAPVSQWPYWGFIDTGGNLVIPLQYYDVHRFAFDILSTFSEGLAAVRLNERTPHRWAYIDTGGNIAVPGEYDMARPFNEGFAAVRQNHRWGFIDTAGNLVVPYEYQDVAFFNEGLAAVHIDSFQDRRREWGFVDTSGNVVVPIEYSQVMNFSEGLAAVRKVWNGEWGFINKNGDVVIPFEYDDVQSFSEGLAAVSKDGKWGYIDTSGNVVLPFEYTRVAPFSEGFALVINESLVGDYYVHIRFIDRNGNEVISLHESLKDLGNPVPDVGSSYVGYIGFRNGYADVPYAFINWIYEEVNIGYAFIDKEGNAFSRDEMPAFGLPGTYAVVRTHNENYERMFGIMYFTDSEGNAQEGQTVSTNDTATAPAPDITVVYNGVKVDFAEVSPTVRNGFTLFPLEYLLDAIFGGHAWDAATNVVYGEKDGNRVEVRLNSLEYWINGEKFDADERLLPYLLDGRTFVYIDYIAEGLGLSVAWDGDTRTIFITD
jgi:hypothetical protein